MYRAILAILLITQFPGCGEAPEIDDEDSAGLMTEEITPATVKETAVAGAFYPDNPVKLDEMLKGFIEEAEVEPMAAGDIFAIFVPHAGYEYSGACAAYAYKAASLHTPKTIVLLSPSHYEYFYGVAYPDYDEFETPLGNIEVDNSCGEAMTEDGDICVRDNIPFSEEHGIEVQLPLIKKMWPEAKIAPFIFGNPSRETADEFAAKLSGYLQTHNDVLVVATCDLSHYHPYDEATKLDAAFIAAFESGNPEAIYEAVDNGKCEIDAPGVVYSTLVTGEEHGFNRTNILDIRNSGDVTGDRDRVVGYWAAVLTK